MSAGNDARQVTRSSFAVQPVQPRQTGAVASGNSARAQIVGGEVRAGVELPGPQTNPGASAGQLGQFFEQALAPQLKRRQLEAMGKGFRDAQAGLGLAEVKKSNGGFSRIFGSTPFEDGARSYHAQSASNEAIRRIAAEADNLKKLSEKDADKAIADTWASVLTGDEETDGLIQQGLFERSGPMLQTLSKARYEWQQTTLSDSQVSSWRTASEAFQAIMTANAAVSDPTDAHKQTVSNATNTLLSNRGMLEGQTDESYGRSLLASLRSDLDAGRLYAFNALRSAGALNVLSDEDRASLMARYHSASHRALAASAKKFLPELMTLRTSIKLEEVKGGAMGAAAELARINARIKADSGTDEDLYDYKDLLKTSDDVVDVLVAKHRRLQARREQLADMRLRRQWEKEDREADEAEETAAVHTIWGMGDINKGTAEGIEGSRFDTVAMAEVRAGNVEGILRAHKSSGWVSRPVANDLQSNVRAGIGKEYSPAIKQAHQQWLTLYQRSPEAAAAYYGKLHAPLLTYNANLRTGLPQAAWTGAFGDPLKYEDRAIPRERQKEAEKAIDDHLRGQGSSWYQVGPLRGRDNLNPYAQGEYKRLMRNELARILSSDPSLPIANAGKQAEAAITSNGQYERYGAFSITNKPGSKPLNQFVGLQGAEMDEVFTHVVTRELKRNGFKEDPRLAATSAKRVKKPDTGQWVLFVEAHNSDNSGSTHAIVPIAALKDYQQHRMDVRLVRRGMNDGPHKTSIVERIKAYRRANPGE